MNSILLKFTDDGKSVELHAKKICPELPFLDNEWRMASQRVVLRDLLAIEYSHMRANILKMNLLWLRQKLNAANNVNWLHLMSIIKGDIQML